MSDDMFSQKCSICNSQPAMLFFRSIQNDNIIEEGLCPRCALQRFSNGESSSMGIPNDEMIKTINEMRHILSDIVGKMSQIPEVQTKNPPQDQNHTCPNCQTSSQYLKKTHIAGCDLCYNSFKNNIKEILDRNKFSVKHQGQVPTRYKAIYLRNLELSKLRTQVQNLLRQESYEEVAKISKRIAKLESQNIEY